jgi:hypothetical protein
MEGSDKITEVSCPLVVLCDKQRQVRIHLPGSMLQTSMTTAG